MEHQKTTPENFLLMIFLFLFTGVSLVVVTSVLGMPTAEGDCGYFSWTLSRLGSLKGRFQGLLHSRTENGLLKKFLRTFFRSSRVPNPEVCNNLYFCIYILYSYFFSNSLIISYSGNLQRNSISKN